MPEIEGKGSDSETLGPFLTITVDAKPQHTFIPASPHKLKPREGKLVVLVAAQPSLCPALSSVLSLCVACFLVSDILLSLQISQSLVISDTGNYCMFNLLFFFFTYVVTYVNVVVFLALSRCRLCYCLTSLSEELMIV